MKLSGFAAGPFQTNCYVLLSEESREAVVIDPGMGAYEPVTEFLTREQATLTAVVCTHGHLDHTRDAARFDVPVYIHPDDEFMLDGGLGLPESTRQLFDAAFMQTPREVRSLLDAHSLTLADTTFTVRHAPGHSPGSVLLVEDVAEAKTEAAGETGPLVFSGDVLFRGAIGRTDFEHSDPAAMRASLRGPVWDLDDACVVLPGHGPTTVMGQERATNPFLLQANPDR